MADRKYILTNEIMDFFGRKLYRIKAVKDFGDVKAGDLGGWLESENNLNHSGCCWVYNEAKVYGNAQVYCDAKIYDSAEIFGNAKVYCNAKVRNNAIIFGNAVIFGYAEIFGNAEVWDTFVRDNATVYGNAKVYGNAHICGDAKIEFDKDYAVFKNTWSSGRYFTWTRSNNKWEVGCFYGTGEELIAKAYKDSELSGKCYEVIVKAQEEISKLNS